MSVPVRVPLVVGVKVAEMLHCAPATRLVPQLFPGKKSPDAVIPVIVSGAVPVFPSVTVIDELVVPTNWFPKFRLDEERLATGAGTETPVPSKLTTCGLPEPLSLIVRLPDKVPNPKGVKVTEIIQLAVGASGDLVIQSSVSA